VRREAQTAGAHGSKPKRWGVPGRGGGGNGFGS